MENIEKKLWIFLLIICSILCMPCVANAKTIDGVSEITVKAVPPKNSEEAYHILENALIEYEGSYFINVDNCNADFTKCSLNQMGGETDKEINIKYSYDKDIQKVIGDIAKNLTKDNYEITDIEYFNWIKYHNLALLKDDDAFEPSLVNFSSEIKKATGYKNFDIDVRMGDDFEFHTERGGIAKFFYDNTLYYVKENPIYVSYNHLFYVDSNSTDMEAAVKSRLIKELGNIYEVDATGETLLECLTSLFENEYDTYIPNDYIEWNYNSKEEYVNVQMQTRVINDDAPYHYLNAYLNSSVYIVVGTFGDRTTTDFIIPVKDSSRIKTSFLTTVDISSDIEISTKGKLPLDALIKIAKLTDGEEYSKIVGILNETNLDMFDLKLFSKATDDYISKLDDESFEVKIPLSEKFKDKNNLVVYYVDGENNVEEYEVKLSDNKKYAIFNTNHFSIYTLAEKKSSDINTSLENTTEVKIEENPQTFDGIISWLILGTISILAFVIITVYRKKLFN